MSYVSNSLTETENVLYSTRVSNYVYYKPILFALFSIIFWMIDYSSALPYIFMVVALFTLLSSYLKIKTSEFAVTTHRVIMKVGVFSTHTIEMFIDNIEGIRVDQDLTGRLLSFGDITIIGTGGTKEKFNVVKNPLEFRKQIQFNM